MMTGKIKYLILLIFLELTFIHVNAQVNFSYESSSQSIRNLMLPSSGETVIFKEIRGTNNGKEFAKYYINNIEVDLNLINGCFNKREISKCKEIEEIIKNNDSNPQQNNTEQPEINDKEDQKNKKFRKPRNKKSQNLWIELANSKSSVFIGEQFSVKLYLYWKHRQIDLLSPFNYRDLQFILNPLNYRNLESSNSLIFPRSLTLEEVKTTFNQNQYLSSLTPLHTILNPEKEGEIFISGKEIISDFNANNLKIKVKPLPEPKPKNFSKFVGKDFKVETDINLDTIKTGESIIYTITISGKGNINLEQDLNINIPKELDLFKEGVKKETFPLTNHHGGKQIIKYIISPETEGDYTIPKIEISYFDPKKEEYITISSDTHNIHVDIGTKTSSMEEYSTAKLELLNEGKYTDINNRNKLYNIFKIIFWTTSIIIILLYLIYIYLNNRTIDIISRKKRRATKIAIKRLKDAKECIKNNNFDLFFEEIEKSLWGYFANKFNVDRSKLSKETIESYFNNYNISNKNKLNFINLLNDCEFSRFSPEKDQNQQMDKILKKSQEIIINVESNT